MNDFLEFHFNARQWAEQIKGLRRRHFEAIGHEPALAVTEKNGGRGPRGRGGESHG